MGFQGDGWGKLKVAACVLNNIIISLLLVSVNKHLFYYEDFSSGLFLSLVHFMVSAFGLWLLETIHWLERSYIPSRKIMSLALAQAFSVFLNNQSLLWNSIGFYQVFKVLTIPLVVIIQYLLYGIYVSHWVIASLSISCVGLGLTSLHDVELNLLGIAAAFSGEICKALSQVLTGQKPKELGVNPLQLLRHQTPISAIYLGMLTILIENTQITEWKHDRLFLDESHIILISASSLLAFLFNVSNYHLIDMVGPLTYNMIGHFKTVLIIGIGHVYFDYPLNMLNTAGISLTIAGVLMYSFLK